MYSARDNKGDLKVCFTLNFKIEYRGRGFGKHFCELPDLGNVILDNKIIILAHILPEILKHIEKSVWPSVWSSRVKVLVSACIFANCQTSKM